MAYSNGMTRLSLSQIQLQGKKGTAQSEQEMAILKKGKSAKIPLKNPSSHNHSK